jgi:heterodisulfide reductase subunit A
VKKNADFCSGVCCMFSIKEALLARKALGEGTEATIFYMDMRTFGKDFQRYRDRAENEQSVRFVRSRPHSIIPAEGGGLSVGWFGDDGVQHEESFDMVVLAVGAKPPKGVDKLARTCPARNRVCSWRSAPPVRPWNSAWTWSGSSAGWKPCIPWSAWPGWAPPARRKAGARSSGWPAS